MKGQKRIRIPKLQRTKPLILIKGRFLTIESIISKKLDANKLWKELVKLPQEHKKELVLERYRLTAKDDKLVEHVLGKGSFNIDDSIREIENDTEHGKELIDIEIQFIARLLRKMAKGEIE